MPTPPGGVQAAEANHGPARTIELSASERGAEGTLARLGRALPAPPWVRFVIALGLLALVAWLDTVTGPEVSFSIFYLIPVVFATAVVSRRVGQAVAVVSAVAWGSVDLSTGTPYSAAWIPYWNSLVRLAFFLFIVQLLAGLLRAHARERLLSRTDSVTGIANARVFREHLERTIAQSRRSKRPFTVVFVDLDHFKRVNDSLGHSEGDRLLREVARTMVNTLRTTDLVARLGGDEFGILMPDTDAEQAGLSIGRVSGELGAAVRGRWPVGATFGAVTVVEPTLEAEATLHLADALMYEGKAAGRGRIFHRSWPECVVAVGEARNRRVEAEIADGQGAEEAPSEAAGDGR